MLAGWPASIRAHGGRHLERLSGDKAQRIVDAMRASVAVRGAAGSTFDHVAREAGVSRGLLHYYFGTKERLLVEVVRRDSDLRLAALDAAIAAARTADDLLAVLVSSLEDLVERDPSFVALHFELFTSARRTPEIAAELAALHRRIREHVAEQLEAKAREGVISPAADAESVVTVLLSLADGLALRMLADPEHDWGPTLAAAMPAARRAAWADAAPSGIRAGHAVGPRGCASASVRARGVLRASARGAPLHPPVARSRCGAQRAARCGRVLLRRAGAGGRRRLRPGCGL